MAKDLSEVTVTVTRSVQIVSPKKLYARTPYYYTIPVSVSTRQPVTGQESVIQWTQKRTPSANGGEQVDWVPNKDLSKLSVTDRKALQMGENPYIINPLDTIVVQHGRKYNDSYTSFMYKDDNGEDVEERREYTNPRDHAELIAIQAGSESTIAKSKSLYQKSRHHFYIDDKEIEAQVELDKIELSYEAENFVRNDIGSGRFGEIVLYMQYAIPEYKIPTPGILSTTRQKEIVLKACREYPKEVLKLKSPDSTRIIFILKLISYGVITRDHNMNFKYGDIHLGVNLDSVVQWMQNMKEHGETVSKWQRILDAKIEHNE